jgi:putative ABC transport system permease protein
MFTRVPLAWANLTANKLRFAASLAGVAFAVVLMFVQYGFKNALLDSTATLLNRLDADLYVVAKTYQSLAMPQPFSRRRLYQALEVPEVAAATPVYVEIGRAVWRNPTPDDATRPPPRRSIRTLGIDPDADLLDLRAAGQDQELEELKLPGRVFFDQQSKPAAFGRIEPHMAERIELAGRPVTVVGVFRLGTDFGAEGNVLVGPTTFAERFRATPGAGPPLGMAELGALRLRPGQRTEAEARQVKEKLQAILPADVSVFTKRELVDRETGFWDRSTPIGGIFGIGMWIGFFVGVVFCFQILSTDVADHLSEFATLKAMGYSNAYLVGVVLQEALLLGAVGFVPGLLVSAGVYWLLDWLTGLPMVLTPGRVGLIFGLTVGMCMLAGTLALRKVIQKDPAEVF